MSEKYELQGTSVPAVDLPRFLLILACKTGCHLVTAEEQQLADDLVFKGMLKRIDGKPGETYVPGYSTTPEGLRWIKQNAKHTHGTNNI